MRLRDEGRVFKESAGRDGQAEATRDGDDGVGCDDWWMDRTGSFDDPSGCVAGDRDRTKGATGLLERQGEDRREALEDRSASRGLALRRGQRWEDVYRRTGE